MADIYYFKINERLNLERLNLGVPSYETIQNKIEKIKQFIYINGQIWELEKLRVVQNIEWTNNPKIC